VSRSFVLDHPQSYIKSDLSFTTSLVMAPLAAKVFGRLEDGVFEFAQHHVDDMFGWPVAQFAPPDSGGFGSMFPLNLDFMSGFLDLCVSTLVHLTTSFIIIWTTHCLTLS